MIRLLLGTILEITHNVRKKNMELLNFLKMQRFTQGRGLAE